MPYIKQEDRTQYVDVINSVVKNLLAAEDENVVKGHLNFIIYSIIKNYLEEKGKRYHRMQDLVGTLECCKHEIYRRIIAPYEDKAIENNGDVT